WGQGRLDAFAAVDNAPRGPTGTLAGTVRSGGSPIPGAQVRAQGPSTRLTETDDAGAYSMLLPVGTYSVTASAFGYIPQTVGGVNIVQDSTTTLNFSLVSAPRHNVSGTVRDNNGNPLAGVRITVLNTPLPSVTTGADGRYSIPGVPVGTYQVSAVGSRCFQGQTAELVVDGPETLDFTLPQRRDSFGYFCVSAPFNYIEANTPISLSGDDASTPVTLPFPFVHYGQTYTTAHVSTNGFLNFLGPNASFSNTTIPNTSPPNAAIYPFWDDLIVDGNSSVRTATIGSAPNRKFVIEWRNVRFFSNASKRLDFEVVLHENGHILMQYRNIANDAEEMGSSATIGIEDHTGTVALQYASGEAAIENNSATLYRLPPSGFIQGSITDANDGRPVRGAQIRALQNGEQIRTTQSAADGTYRLQVPVGSYTIEASASNYSVETATANVEEDAQVIRNFALRTPRAEARPGALQLIVPQGRQRRRIITLRNTGTLEMTWQLGESGGRPAATVSNMDKKRNPDADPNARDTRGLFAGEVHAGWRPDAPGDIIRSFPPVGLALAWGVGYTGNVWLSDVPNNRRNHEFTPQGSPTGRNWPTPWAGAWPGDMAWDSRHNAMCQVNVGGDNGIYCWDIATGNVTGSITGAFPWTSTSQRGLAYRPDDDSFYIGGWNQGTIYHIKGLSHADKGAVIDSCRPADGSISGLAYNPASETLWVATNSQTDTMYQLNPADCTVLSTLAHPTPGFKGAGMEMAEDGNLWIISQSPNMVYLIDSGVPAFNDVPWMNVSPTRGTLPPGASVNIEVSVDTTGLNVGTYLAALFIRSNSARESSMRIPVSLIVPQFQKGVNSGSSVTYVDHLGDPWVRDKMYRPGDWGYLRENGNYVTHLPIRGTVDQALFRTQRVDPYAYRFDGLPNGMYSVELRFAELEDTPPGERLFDVIVQNQLVLPAYDIAFSVGNLTADYHTFFVPVTNGRLDVRFIPRGFLYPPPVINSIRVTHRPDRQ
ncbi:MAG: carboxypeptidase regulatory-like domain-containing protein, partial [Myxococcales bacterium]|nr:carboxypeptidase regulatory-like domain-containing protein [Myxococcales bacterium]